MGSDLIKARAAIGTGTSHSKLELYYVRLGFLLRAERRTIQLIRGTQYLPHLSRAPTDVTVATPPTTKP